MSDKIINIFLGRPLEKFICHIITDKAYLERRKLNIIIINIFLKLQIKEFLKKKLTTLILYAMRMQLIAMRKCTINID